MAEKENDLVEESAAAAGVEAGAEASEASVAAQPEELAVLLEDARSKADENWNLCLRLQADLENLRKRSERDPRT